jgi:hypothetical protein
VKGIWFDVSCSISKSSFASPANGVFEQNCISKCLVYAEPRFGVNMDRTQKLPQLPSLNSEISEIPAQSTTKPSLSLFFLFSVSASASLLSRSPLSLQILGKNLISVGYFS